MPIWKRKEQGLSSQARELDNEQGIYVYPNGVDCRAIAGSIVGASVIVRKTEQSLNFNSLFLAFVVLVVIPGLWIRALGNKIHRQTERANAQATRMAAYKAGTMLPDSIYPAGTPVPLDAGGIQNAASTQFYATLQAGYTATPTITLTVIPSTFTPSPTSQYSVEAIFRYSYYNPKLGGINCFDWDMDNQDCRSMMADGSDWRTAYGKAVACPPDIALGTVLDVHYPDALKGIWVCRDRGSAITGNIVDFLDIRQRAEWLSSVSVTLYPPNTPLQQVGKGTH